MPDPAYDGRLHSSPASPYDGLVAGLLGGSIAPGDATASGSTVTSGGPVAIVPGDATASGGTIGTVLVVPTVTADATASGGTVTATVPPGAIAPGDATASGSAVTVTVPAEAPSSAGGGGGFAGYRRPRFPFAARRMGPATTSRVADRVALQANATVTIRPASARADGVRVTTCTHSTTSSVPLLASGTTVTVTTRQSPSERVLREEEDLAVLMLLGIFDA